MANKKKVKKKKNLMLRRTKQFVRKIQELLNSRSRTSDDILSDRFRKAVFDYGSDTKDNRAIIDNIEIEELQNGNKILVFTNEDHLLPLINYISQLEDIKCPIEELSDEQWGAMTRLITLTFQSLEE